MKNNKGHFLDFLIDHDLEVFSFAQVSEYFSVMSKADYEFVEDLARKGVLTQLRSGLYAVNPRREKGHELMPNWHKVAEALVYPKEYYIAYYSALQVHELIIQPALREYVVVKERTYPKVRHILNIPFEIIYSKEAQFFGYKKKWINDHDKIFCSDLEKTIIDCLHKPQYAGGMEGIVKAMDKASEKIKPNVLVDYAIRFNVQAVIKRLGYVLDKMKLYPTEQNILNQLITDAYTRLDPSLKIKGSFHRKWRIEDNVDLEELLQTTET